MTANVMKNESNLLRNPHCLSAGIDSLYLLFKSTLLASNYPCIANSATAVPRFKNVII